MLTPAGELESQRLEFKSWCNDERDFSREIGDAAVCLASTDGGLLVLGVDDKAVGSRAFARCPHKGVNVDWVRAKICELTKPPVRCHVHKVSDLLPALRGELKGDLIVVDLPKTIHISGHRNSKGVSLKRYDRSCKPEYFEDQDDFSLSLVEHLDLNVLDKASMSERELRTERAKRHLVSVWGTGPQITYSKPGL
jgi:Putative DNA-binding domain